MNAADEQTPAGMFTATVANLRELADRLEKIHDAILPPVLVNVTFQVSTYTEAWPVRCAAVDTLAGALRPELPTLERTERQYGLPLLAEPFGRVRVDVFTARSEL